jgi:hypothetical protein
MQGTNYAALTGETPIKEYYENALKRVRWQLQEFDTNELLATEDADLVAVFMQDYWKLEVIEEAPDQPPAVVQDERIGRTIEMQLVPRESNQRALQLRGSSFPYTLAHRPQYLFRVEDHVLVMPNLPPNTHQIQETIKLARRIISCINEEIPKWAEAFRAEGTRLIQEHKTQVRQKAQAEALIDQQLQGMGLVLKKKPNAIEPVNVTVKKPVQILRNLPTVKPEPGAQFVHPTALQEVIRLIDQAGKNFEVAPATYNKLEEEDLRNIIVATLNAVFESNVASGETFSRLGKSDIRLNVPAGDVLIAECKIWRGQAEYGSENIPQLFRYLTHRHSVGMLITFVRTKGLKEVIERAAAATTSHPSYQGKYQLKAPTYFVSTHEHPTDSQVTVEVHHLFFHLYGN